VRVKGALAEIHRRHAVDSFCLICGRSTGLSLHHVYDRSDVWENLVFLCGSGTTGCHGAVTANDAAALADLGAGIARDRPDVVAYVLERPGGRDWLRRRLRLYLSEDDQGGKHGEEAAGRDG